MHSFRFVGAISELFIEGVITLAFVTGEQLISLGVAEKGLHLSHEPLPNSSILEVRVNDEPPYMAGIVF